jgi:fibronectin type 3 domain-containing protein
LVYGIAIANIDADSDLEVIVFGQNENYNALYAFKKNGTQVSGYPIILEDLISGWWFGNHPAIGDLDGNGTLEIAATVWTIGEARLYAWHQDGTPLSSEGGKNFLASSKSPDAQREKEALSSLGTSIGEIVTKIKGMTKDQLNQLMSTSQEPPFASETETFGSPILADVNGDGNPDIIVRAGYLMSSGYERVFAWDYQGNLINGWPLYAAGYNSYTFYPYTPVIADMDRDGKLDMVLAAGQPNHKLTSWEFDTPYDANSIPWPKYMHDKWNSGRLGFKPEEEGMPNVPPPNFHVETWTDSSATLAWSPRAPWLSLGYNIYRDSISGQPGEKINTSLIPRTENQYTDSGLHLGGTYYYTITNVDTSSQESNRSREVKIIIGQPSAPVGLKAKEEGCAIRLSWLANPPEQNVIKYRIFRKGPRDTANILFDSTVTETTYLDNNITKAGVHRYLTTAVNALGESDPSAPDSVNFQLSTLKPPDNLRTSSWSGTNITLVWKGSGGGGHHQDTSYPDIPDTGTVSPKLISFQGGNGCNVYRSTVSGIFGDSAINSAPITDTVYQDTGLTEGVTYYYTAARIGECGVESELSNQVEFLAGRPHTPNLKAKSGKKAVELHISPPPDADIEGYRIYRNESGGDFYVLDSLHLDTTYIDNSAIGGISYHYKVTAIDTLGLESFPSEAVEGIVISLNRGIVVVDMTRPYEYYTGVNSDSVDAFYQRVLRDSLGYGYTYLSKDSDTDTLHLIDLSTYSVAIVHSEEKDILHALSSRTYEALKGYLEAGGALLIEGRRNLSAGEGDSGLRHFASEDFRHDGLNMDSAFISIRPTDSCDYEGEFIGMNGTAQMEGYPQAVELDTGRVNRAYEGGGDCVNQPKGVVAQGRLTGVGYFFPVNPSEVIYTFVSAYPDTSSSHGKPVALQHITDSCKVIYFDFPLWFVKEDIATQILHKALESLGIMTYKAGDADGDGTIDIADVVYLINYLFIGGPAPVIMEAGDANGDCGINVVDVVYLINYLFVGGPAPVSGCATPGNLGKVVNTKEGVVIDATYEEGITTISSNSPVELLAFQLELESANKVTPLNLTDNRLDLVYGSKDDTLKIGLLDLDGGKSIPAGRHPLIQLNGKCKLVSALVCDRSFTSLSASINSTSGETNVPLTFALNQNYPNPFNSETAIGYDLPKGSEVKITIYNILGQKVKTLVDEKQAAGHKRITWDGKNNMGQPVGSGMYFYRIEAGDFVQNKRMLLLK